MERETQTLLRTLWSYYIQYITGDCRPKWQSFCLQYLDWLVSWLILKGPVDNFWSFSLFCGLSCGWSRFVKFNWNAYWDTADHFFSTHVTSTSALYQVLGGRNTRGLRRMCSQTIPSLLQLSHNHHWRFPQEVSICYAILMFSVIRFLSCRNGHTLKTSYRDQT